jgi:hypothetical protein
MVKRFKRQQEIPELFTPDDIERLFHIPKSTQAAMRSRREIPFVLVGARTPRYLAGEISDWLAARAVPERDK